METRLEFQSLSPGSTF